MPMQLRPRKKPRLAKGGDTSDGDTPSTEITLNPVPKAVTNTNSMAVVARKRVRRTVVEGITELPVEILCIVLSYAHPRDLCSLTRVCKTFRKFFLTRDMQRAWIASMDGARNPPIPQCPPWKSEVAWCHLLFVPFCHVCGCRTDSVIWPWFTRYCHACSLTQSYELRKVLNLINKSLRESLDPSRLLACCVIDTSGKKDYFGQYAEQRYHIAEVHQFLRKLESIPAGPLGAEDRQKAIDEQRTLLPSCEQLAEECGRWHGEELDAHANILYKKRSARFQEILARLKDTEWASELERMKWQDVLQVLIPVFTNRRNRRLCAARFPILEDAIEPYYVLEYPRTPEQDYRLHFWHFALAKPIRAIILRPEGETVTIDDFVAVMGDAELAWWAERKAVLRENVVAALKDAGIKPPAKSSRTDVLDLAIANVFRCRNCGNSVLGYRKAILHPCEGLNQMSPVGRRNAGAKQRDLYVTLVLMHERGRSEHECERWGPLFKPSREVATFELSFVPLYDPERVASLLCVMKMDPAKATAEQLCASGARVVCRTCETARRKCLQKDTARTEHSTTVFCWQAAIAHFSHRTTHDFRWELVPKKHMGVVREVEAKEGSMPISRGAFWSCSLCKWEGTYRQVEHWKQKHEPNYDDSNKASALAELSAEKKMYPHPISDKIIFEPCDVKLPM
ncbi:uncharacterized protein BXZ73DRAFT_98624 [Epithele typhae]|uniref:uncharacterized protein n=1 Tax=Epithele typhae TaxID=378194 RepID=UPI0020089757|nr:uncharacterized protein BXZ73DRAFT_98624 [Epithele typhae]KAH9940797.1 hypothetical protein BXZ73DRAFT_98624 [Epithele typhae]